MFAPEEWEQARQVHERWSRNLSMYRRWGDFARQTLMRGASMNVSVTLASDPEAFKAELHRIGVNVNQIARTANLAGSVASQQVRELLNLLASIGRKMELMEREKAEIDAAQGLY
ncbi:MAG: mobilization protein [Bifidobacterium bifidum]|nr:MAG: mobilization protein [Bifidobacterium bifidum]